MILLDISEEQDNRLLAAECLSEFLLSENSKDIITYVENYLYSSPLPSNADINGAIEFAKELKADELTTLLVFLRDNQEEIKKRCEVYDSLPLSCFEFELDKEQFKLESINNGVFRIFITKKHHGSALHEIFLLPLYGGRTNARKIFTEWAKPFKESIGRIGLPNAKDLRRNKFQYLL